MWSESQSTDSSDLLTTPVQYLCARQVDTVSEQLLLQQVTVCPFFRRFKYSQRTRDQCSFHIQTMCEIQYKSTMLLKH